MKRTYDIYLKDILHSIERILEYVGSQSYEEFIQDQKTLDAVLRNLEIIGEAVHKLPETITAAHPDVPWAHIRGFCNVVVHTYWSVDTEIVWDIITNKLTPLQEQIHTLL